MKDWSDVVRYFSGGAVAHLATLDTDGSPHSVPLWIDRHGDSELVFFTIEGSRKDRNLARDPRVAVSVTAPDNAYDMASVRGVVVERVDGGRGQDIIDQIARKYTGAAYPVRTGHVAFVVRPTAWWAQDHSSQ
ncbi:TIGR03618 family F420-dependent PPOX class oxidoreductase [Promicromonospora sp. NPDC059942]|uniref:TIGR03618 family F420-dependent PPOX class oxidoreductase n=1 Tax=Promicromonospora sp. NPDC059942 TaxID=3347009 RepID=UPI00365947FB